MSTLATYIRDAIYTRLTASMIKNNWKSSRRSPIPTLSDDDLPCLSVYLTREQMQSDGDENVSVPRYVSDAIIGISVFDSATKAETLDGQMDPIVDLIEDTLLQDPTFVALKWTDGSALIEGIPSITRTYAYPQSGEHYFMEVRLQMTIRFRMYFAPTFPNALTDVVVGIPPYQNKLQGQVFSADIQPPQ